MKTRIVTLALAVVFGLGLVNAQKIKDVKPGTEVKKEMKAEMKEMKKGMKEEGKKVVKEEGEKVETKVMDHKTHKVVK